MIQNWMMLVSKSGVTKAGVTDDVTKERKVSASLVSTEVSIHPSWYPRGIQGILGFQLSETTQILGSSLLQKVVRKSRTQLWRVMPAPLVSLRALPGFRVMVETVKLTSPRIGTRRYEVRTRRIKIVPKAPQRGYRRKKTVLMTVLFQSWKLISL